MTTPVACLRQAGALQVRRERWAQLIVRRRDGIRYNGEEFQVRGTIGQVGGAAMVMFSDKVSVPGHVLVRFLDKEAVLLNIETERYFGLDETGARMWQLATTASNIDAAYQALLNEYDVDGETLREHLSELLEKLVDNGLLTLTSSDVGTASAI